MTDLPLDIEETTDQAPKFSRLLHSIYHDGTIGYGDEIGLPENFPLTEAELAEVFNPGTPVYAPLGYVGRAGISGSFVNTFNIAWTGSVANLWIDATNVGAIQVSSDYRIKKNIQTQTAPAIERIKLLRPITYELKDYESLVQSDGVQREGFIAHEVQEVIPSGAEGEKDEEGRIQNLRLDAIVSVLTKAMQEAVERIESLEAEVATLKAL